MAKLKWTIKRSLEVVYTGTLKDMTYFTGYAELRETNGDLYGCGRCADGIKVGKWN